MKVTRQQIRSILMEAMSSSDPQDLYNRYLELGGNSISSQRRLVKLGEDVYNELLDTLNQIRAEDPTREGYKKFFAKVTVPPFRLLPATAFALFHPDDVGRGMEALPWDEALAESQEHEDLQAQFETQDATDMTDRMYGRRRTIVVHKPTGTTVSNGVNRKGSLGS